MKKLLALAGITLLAILWMRSRTATVPGQTVAVANPSPTASTPAQATSNGPAQATPRKVPGAPTSRPEALPVQAFRYERIHELADQLPDHCVTSRRIMTNLSALLAIGDAVHSNRSLPDKEIERLASESTGLPSEIIAGLLSRYPASTTDSLARHYFKALRNPELQAVSKAFQQVGVPLDLASDLLMDGFRLCSLQTSHDTFMGNVEKDMRFAPEGFDPLPECLAEAERLAEERSRGIQLIENAFRERFISRHGLQPSTADALMTQLRSLRVETAGDIELTIPRLRAM